MFDWSATIDGIRPISKKNSRILTSHGSLPSQAYKTFHAKAMQQLAGQEPAEPYAGAVIVELEVYMKGKLTADIDNLCNSWLDTLQDAGVLLNDDQVVEIHAYKHRNATDWRSEIHVVGTE